MRPRWRPAAPQPDQEAQIVAAQPERTPEPGGQGRTDLGVIRLPTRPMHRRRWRAWFCAVTIRLSLSDMRPPCSALASIGSTVRRFHQRAIPRLVSPTSRPPPPSTATVRNWPRPTDPDRRSPRSRWNSISCPKLRGQTHRLGRTGRTLRPPRPPARPAISRPPGRAREGSAGHAAPPLPARVLTSATQCPTLTRHRNRW